MTPVKEVIFYILLGVFYVIFFLSTTRLYQQSTSSITKGLYVGMSAFMFTLIFIGYSKITGLFNNEGFNYCPSPGPKLCRGGAYTWQGDSKRAKYCRKLASTPEGLDQINRYNCGDGFNGMPGNGFKFTPISNDCWRNERCDTPDECNNGIF